MPYSFGTPTVTDAGTHRGRKHYLLTVTETGVTGNTDEWSVALASFDLPRVGTVKAVSCVIGGGAATTVDPQAGMVATGTDVYVNGSAGSPVFYAPPASAPAIIWPHAATLYGQSKANNTATSIVTKILIAEGTDG